jgi:hypothetical protein
MSGMDLLISRHEAMNFKITSHLNEARLVNWPSVAPDKIVHTRLERRGRESMTAKLIVPELTDVCSNVRRVMCNH